MRMQDSKETRWNVDSGSDPGADANVPDRKEGSDEAGAESIDGWRGYRKWASSRRRGNIDRSLYTWKGYRTWSEQIKRNWPES